MQTRIPDVLAIETDFFRDDRGFFIESYHRQNYAQHGIVEEFVQDNHSRSRRGVLRGFHYQDESAPMGKLVRCLEGEILDVAVDLRRSSPTFGRHVTVELAAGDGQQLFVPEGFAHGFMTLEPDSMVAYKVTNGYEPKAERGIAWDDPDLAIAWPGALKESAILSERDRKWPRLKNANDLF